MSQYDTGMGWSAKSDWLKSGQQVLMGTLSLGHIISEDAPAIIKYGPGAPSDSDVVSYNYYAICAEGNVYFLIYKTDSAPDNCAMAAYQDGSVLHMVMMRTDPGTTSYAVRLHNPATDTTWQLSVYDNSFVYNPDTGLYEFDWVWPGDYHTPLVTGGTIPTFMTAADRTAAYATTQRTFYKMNHGYAVECFASWYTTEGTHLMSPVLISTVPSATVITEDGTTPATGHTEFDFLYDGTRFYMTIVGGIDAERATIRDTAVEEAQLEQFGAAAPSKVFNLIANSSFSNIVVISAPDPYQEGEGSEEAGGDGEDTEDDPVEEETMALPSVAGLGFCSVYVPTQSDLLAMSAYLWSGSFDVNQVIKLFSNPMDSIIGLSAVPVDLVGTYEPIYLGGVLLQNVTMPRYSGRTAVKVDMGTVSITEKYGAYLDYDPYTQFSIYLPFVGIKNIKADDIMGKTISLMYDIDILTGACVAYLRPAGGSVLYEWAGQCAVQIPITGSNWDNIFRNAVSAATAIGGALIAPGAAPVLGGAVASAAVQAIAAKPTIERSGAVSGTSGFLGQLRPYIIRTNPEAYIPASQNTFIGYPAYINVAMSGITGYNVVSSVHLEGIPATGNELSEIESLLKGGVIF